MGISQIHVLGSTSRASAWAVVDVGLTRSPLRYWASRWDIWPIYLSLSVSPQPLCTDCVGKGCNCLCDGCYLHVSVQINPDRRHKWSVNDYPLGFAPIFPILLSFIFS